MSPYELNIRLAFMVGIFLTSAIFFLLFYFSLRRKTSLLWLSLYCFSHPIKTLFKPYQELVNNDFLSIYQNHSTSQFIVVIGGFFLIGFIIWELNLLKKNIWITLFGVFSILSYFKFSDEQYSYSLIIIGISLSSYGVLKKSKGARWLLLGMLGYTVLNYLGQIDLLGFAYFTGIIFFIFCMLLSVGQNVAEESKKQRQALLRAATLENQLLKTSIQPHFVFNSLAALQELIERDSSKASDFVDRLAKEFQLITKFSSKGLIPIKEEIELCKLHLGIMEYRKNGQFDFKIKGINYNEYIPPGIFHTLIENGITHGYSNKNEGNFILNKSETNDKIVYTLFNDSDIEIETDVVLGTGLRYVKAALEEHYEDDANISWCGNKEGWTVTIIIKK